MGEYDLDALVVTSKENVIYYTGLMTIGWDSKHRPLGAILPREKDRPLLVIPDSLFFVAQESSWIEELRPWGGAKIPTAARDPILAFTQGIKDLGLEQSRIGMELGYGQRIGMPQTDYEALRASLPEAHLMDASAALWQQRMIKSPREIDAMRAVCQVTSDAFRTTFQAMQQGMTERELAGVMFQGLSRSNYRPGFVMVRSGPLKYRMINVEPFDKPLNRGDLVVVDAGATYKYYWADFMRMAAIGEPTKEQRAFFECDLASQKAGVAAIRPGIPGKAVFEACQAVIDNMGFHEHAALERVGHGLGLDVHEPPSLGFDSTVTLQEGMILTVEPIFYDKPNGQVGNFALEDVVLVTRHGHEVLSTFPKDLWIV